LTTAVDEDEDIPTSAGGAISNIKPPAATNQILIKNPPGINTNVVEKPVTVSNSRPNTAPVSNAPLHTGKNLEEGKIDPSKEKKSTKPESQPVANNNKPEPKINSQPQSTPSKPQESNPPPIEIKTASTPAEIPTTHVVGAPQAGWGVLKKIPKKKDTTSGPAKKK